tara:strand:+ start:366 stop:713 length:348 start_codon:yes stop_codon:yes gene_type:complete
MAKQAADDFSDEFHIYRHYALQPVYRWACCLVPDPATPSGFVLSDSDPTVADSSFLTRLDRSMRKEHQTMVAQGSHNDGIYDTIETIYPGDPGFIEVALYGLQREGFAHQGPAPE